MAVERSHASGIIMSTACGSDRPDWTRSSTTSSKLAESLIDSVMMGVISETANGNTSLRSDVSRAVIQFRLPRTVLISPLWAM